MNHGDRYRNNSTGHIIRFQRRLFNVSGHFVFIKDKSVEIITVTAAHVASDWTKI